MNGAEPGMELGRPHCKNKAEKQDLDARREDTRRQTAASTLRTHTHTGIVTVSRHLSRVTSTAIAANTDTPNKVTACGNGGWGKKRPEILPYGIYTSSCLAKENSSAKTGGPGEQNTDSTRQQRRKVDAQLHA